MKTFGPVPSRRLGRSLGINNIPPKNCPYSCIYCQLGHTLSRRVERKPFYHPREIVDSVSEALDKIARHKEKVDYLTFVADGEPTLDKNLGKVITTIKALKIPVAVITNASLIWRDDVRKDLMRADWVSLKVDSVHNCIWKRINEPKKELNLSEILEGILKFTAEFRGKLVTETMLVKGVNDGEEHITEVAGFIYKIHPDKAYLSIPVRPPAMDWVLPPDENVLTRAFCLFEEKGLNVEYLSGYEGNAFSFSGDFQKDILSITSVHPMREEAVKTLIENSGASWSEVEDLLGKNLLKKARYKGHVFYLRNLNKQFQT